MQCVDYHEDIRKAVIAMNTSLLNDTYIGSEDEQGSEEDYV